MTRVVVIGAGPAGLVAAIRLAEGGARVALLNKGTGGLQLGQGTFDILGYGPDRVERPLDALAGFAEAHPGHPYGVLPADLVARSANYLRDLVGPGSALVVTVALAVTALFFGVVVFGEQLTPRIMLGVLMILTAVTLIIAAKPLLQLVRRRIG